jgi:Cu+-exporting ATPase
MSKKETIKIAGMSCAACAVRIEKGLSRVEGVKSAAVNFAVEKAAVEYDESIVSRDMLDEVIKKLGYDVIKEQAGTAGSVTLKVGGMTCAACAARIEKKLNSMEGVEKAAVNLASERASVEYDSSRLKVSDLIKAVEGLGYQAQRAEEVSADREKEQREKEIKILRLELIVSAVLSAPLLFAMVLMLLNADIPIFHDPYFQLILATPIQFIIGSRFYKHAFYALRAKSANMDVLIAMGTSAAYFFSIYNAFFAHTGDGMMMKDLYFEASAVIITLILLGKYLEALAKGKTSDAIRKLMGLQAKTARVIRNGREEDIPIEEVEVGDIIVVRPGEKCRLTA